MKTCPTCSRTYADDTLNYCLDDGSTLATHYDQVQARSLPPTRLASPAPTEVLSPASLPSEQQAPLVPTIQALQPPNLYQAKPQATPKAQSHGTRWGVIIVGACLLFIAGGGVVLALVWFAQRSDSDSQRENILTNTNARPSPTATVTVDEVWNERHEAASLNGVNLTYYPASTPEQCQLDCGQNRKCKGFTYIRAGAYNPRDPPMCYLASEVTAVTPHSCCISAVKR
jgi:PAN domain